jgi:signal peptidase I
MEIEQSQISTEPGVVKPYRRKIWVTVLLNLVNPALPLIYNGNLKGGLFVALLFLLLPFILYPLGGLSFKALIIVVFIDFIIWIGLLIFNIKYTSKANRLDFSRLRRTRSWIFGLFLLYLLISTANHILIKHYFVEAYKLPSSSMANTLIIGDYLMASKNTDTANLKRNDLIIFKFPGDTHQNYFKRLIGMEGDRIKIINKQLYVNDQLIPLPPEGIYSDSTRVCPHTDEKRWVINVNAWGNAGGYWEYLGNRDNMPEVTVPQGQFFVLGDNRDNSADSRYWGFVDSKLVVGKAKFIHFSWDSEKYRIRWERMGKRLE